MTGKMECLVALYVSTSGGNGDELGADERELVQLVWQVVDLESNKVIPSSRDVGYLPPACTCSVCILTPMCVSLCLTDRGDKWDCRASWCGRTKSGHLSADRTDGAKSSCRGTAWAGHRTGASVKKWALAPYATNWSSASYVNIFLTMFK